MRRVILLVLLLAGLQTGCGQPQDPVFRERV